MHLARTCSLVVALFFSGLAVAGSGEAQVPVEDYCEWQVTDYEIKEPLCSLKGDSKRGRDIVSDSGRGNCIACHTLPLKHISVYGTIGPSLVDIGKRLNEGQLRLRVADTRQINPMSIMPGFYRHPSLINRPDRRYIGRTFLTAQQVEDVVAYLKALK